MQFIGHKEKNKKKQKTLAFNTGKTNSHNTYLKKSPAF